MIDRTERRFDCALASRVDDMYDINRSYLEVLVPREIQWQPRAVFSELPIRSGAGIEIIIDHIIYQASCAPIPHTPRDFNLSETNQKIVSERIRSCGPIEDTR